MELEHNNSNSILQDLEAKIAQGYDAAKSAAASIAAFQTLNINSSSSRTGPSSLAGNMGNNNFNRGLHEEKRQPFYATDPNPSLLPEEEEDSMWAEIEQRINQCVLDTVSMVMQSCNIPPGAQYQSTISNAYSDQSHSQGQNNNNNNTNVDTMTPPLANLVEEVIRVYPAPAAPARAAAQANSVTKHNDVLSGDSPASHIANDPASATSGVSPASAARSVSRFHSVKLQSYSAELLRQHCYPFVSMAFSRLLDAELLQVFFHTDTAEWKTWVEFHLEQIAQIEKDHAEHHKSYSFHFVLWKNLLQSVVSKLVR